MTCEGKIYQTPSDQWSWVITKDGEELVRGAGYENEEEALEAMENELVEFRSRVE